MVLDVIVNHDDAFAAATAGLGNGGTALTAALTKDDDLSIRMHPTFKTTPVLRDVLLGEFDVLTNEVVNKAFVSLQIDGAPDETRIVERATHAANEITESGAGTAHIQPIGDSRILVTGKYNKQLEADTTWVNANTKAGGTIINADLAILLVYQYGSAIPYKPGNRLIRISKVADAASAAADVFDEAWYSQLLTTQQGLDPGKNYILRGVGYESAAVDKLNAVARIGVKGSDNKICGLGPGNFLGYVETLYLFDGIPCKGDSFFKAETLGGVADTAWVTAIFEELGGSAEKAADNPGTGINLDMLTNFL